MSHGTSPARPTVSDSPAPAVSDSPTPAERRARYAELLDRVQGLPTIAGPRRRTLELLGLRAGQRAVDVGSGIGRAVAELAGTGVRAVGLEPDEAMVRLARERFPDDRFPTAGFRVGRAERLPFDDGSMDGYRAERVLHLLADPAVALAEARRVLRPGGRVVLLGPDLSMAALDADDAATTAAVVAAHADGVPSPRAARAFRRLLLDAGFVDVEVEAHTELHTDFQTVGQLVTAMAEASVATGALDRPAADRWLAGQRRRGREDRFLMALPLFLASAARPAGPDHGGGRRVPARPAGDGRPA
ncbi:methyltransferase domain-containing protein [Allostreptomyces psammosilenae]|uniref:SAM-dependent methyltransferase n=1 Tax=Allostreptomyces psammosilenae TaxID=1892865 RepID=A0A852ZWB8_9ACTN|nr:methyltransferase domain-containing protein [Allostreptomyces psammosilenae]NYI05054.1 SAM-dependent methyltransferase [Allostreptomyces psammosilenae]